MDHYHTFDSCCEKMESQEEIKEKLLQFLPFSSVVESTFWHKLSQLKIDVYALKDEPVDITGYYSNHTAPRLPACLNVDYSSFEKYMYLSMFLSMSVSNINQELFHTEQNLMLEGLLFSVKECCATQTPSMHSEISTSNPQSARLETASGRILLVELHWKIQIF